MANTLEGCDPAAVFKSRVTSMQRIAKADGSSLDLPDDRVYRVDLRGFISSGASASFIARAKSLGALKSAAGGWVSRGRAVGGAAAVAAAEATGYQCRCARSLPSRFASLIGPADEFNPKRCNSAFSTWQRCRPDLEAHFERTSCRDWTPEQVLDRRPTCCEVPALDVRICCRLPPGAACIQLETDSMRVCHLGIHSCREQATKPPAAHTHSFRRHASALSPRTSPAVGRCLHHICFSCNKTCAAPLSGTAGKTLRRHWNPTGST